MTSSASLPGVGTGGDHAAVALWPDLTGQKYSRRQADRKLETEENKEFGWVL